MERPFKLLLIYSVTISRLDLRNRISYFRTTIPYYIIVRRNVTRKIYENLKNTYTKLEIIFNVLLRIFIYSMKLV